MCLREVHGDFELENGDDPRLDVSQFVHAFRGADLRRIVLSSLDDVKLEWVTQITTTFPNLEFLSFSFNVGLSDVNETRREDIVSYTSPLC